MVSNTADGAAAAIAGRIPSREPTFSRPQEMAARITAHHTKVDHFLHY